MKVEIYSDVACPWCYIGKRRFDQALASFEGASDVEVVYRPFQLDPGAPATAYPLMERLEAKFGPRAPAMVQRVTEAGRGEGIDMRFDIALAANTLAAHRLLYLAEREHGAATQLALADELFEAHFTRGRDIGDVDQLVALAESVGMDRERVRGALGSNEGREETLAAIAQAREIGITAVPTFIFDGRYALEGGQPAPVVRQALETVARQRMAAVATTSGEACPDDDCPT